MGIVLIAKAFAPYIDSIVGSVDGMYAYRASKSACCNIAKSLSIDLAGCVSVVLLHPGYIRTHVRTSLR